MRIVALRVSEEIEGILYPPMIVHHAAVPPSGNWVSSSPTLSKPLFVSDGSVSLAVRMDDTLWDIFCVERDIASEFR